MKNHVNQLKNWIKSHRNLSVVIALFFLSFPVLKLSISVPDHINNVTPGTNKYEILEAIIAGSFANYLDARGLQSSLKEKFAFKIVHHEAEKEPYQLVILKFREKDVPKLIEKLQVSGFVDAYHAKDPYPSFFYYSKNSDLYSTKKGFNGNSLKMD